MLMLTLFVKFLRVLKMLNSINKSLRVLKYVQPFLLRRIIFSCTLRLVRIDSVALYFILSNKPID